MDKNQVELYSFFNHENYQEKNEIVINIDKRFATFDDVCDYIGECLYKDCPEANGIEIGTYFGGNFDSFNDCLRTFLLSDQREISLRINIIERVENLSDKDVYVLLYLFYFLQFHFNINKKLRVFVSRNIMEIYMKESDRLMSLDTKPEDMFQF